MPAPNPKVKTYDVLLCVAAGQGGGFTKREPLELLVERTGLPWKVCFRAMERESKKKLIDSHDNYFSYSRLTDAGKALFHELRPANPLTVGISETRHQDCDCSVCLPG